MSRIENYSSHCRLLRGRILDYVAPVKPDDIHRVGFLVTGIEVGPFALEVGSVQAERQQNM